MIHGDRKTIFSRKIYKGRTYWHLGVELGSVSRFCWLVREKNIRASALTRVRRCKKRTGNPEKWPRVADLLPRIRGLRNGGHVPALTAYTLASAQRSIDSPTLDVLFYIHIDNKKYIIKIKLYFY